MLQPSRMRRSTSGDLRARRERIRELIGEALAVEAHGRGSLRHAGAPHAFSICARSRTDLEGPRLAGEPVRRALRAPQTVLVQVCEAGRSTFSRDIAYSRSPAASRAAALW